MQEGRCEQVKVSLQENVLKEILHFLGNKEMVSTHLRQCLNGKLLVMLNVLT